MKDNISMMVTEDSTRKNPNVESKNPAPEQIERAIAQLDGKNHTMLVLVIPGVSTLTIGGGENDLCVVDLTIGDNEEFYCLADRAGSMEEVDMVVGRQKAPFQERLRFEKNTILNLIHQWSENDGAIPSNYEWIDPSET